MKYLQHQPIFSAELKKILTKQGYVGLLGEPRSGKTLTAIHLCESLAKVQKVLIVCPKGAVGGWNKWLLGDLDAMWSQSKDNPNLNFSAETIKLTKKYTITNFEQVGRIDRSSEKPKLIMKVNRDVFDLVIVDESHRLGAYPKPSQITKIMDYFCKSIPHVHLSGTMYTETLSQAYHQFTLGKYRPFKEYTNFYKWFAEYGKPYTVNINGNQVARYDKIKASKKEELNTILNSFVVPMTQKDAGIEDLKAKDKVHYIELSTKTKKLYNLIVKDKYALVDGVELIADTTMKEQLMLHQIEGGSIKFDILIGGKQVPKYMDLGNREKIDYIKKTFGDTKDTGIMSHFIGERKLLEREFKHATIYSSTAHAEGVDLSHLKNFVIYSNTYSGVKHVQRRERIINAGGSDTDTVHHILIKNGISDQVYKAVSKKLDFNNATYIRKAL